MTSHDAIALLRDKIRELEQAIRVLESLETPKSQWEHMLAALDRAGRPVNPATLAKLMIEGGWRTESKNPVALVTVSLRDRVKKKEVVKMGRGLYGRPEWIAPAAKKVRQVRKRGKNEEEQGT